MCPQCYLGVTLKFSVVPQRSCCENWGWEEAGAEQEAPRVAGSRWDQASAALEIHRRSSQTTMDRPNTSGGDLRGEAAQGGWNPAWMGWGVAEPLTHPAPLAPQPRPERCRSLSRPRAARHGHRSHRRGSQCHTHHPATHAWKGSCPQPSVLTPSLAQGWVLPWPWDPLVLLWDQECAAGAQADPGVQPAKKIVMGWRGRT